jgi:hypothetical protein
MRHFSPDLSHLDNVINKRSIRVKSLDGFEKVAWDVVRFPSKDQASKLWEVQAGDDGDYIISLYDEEEVPKTAGWDVVLSKTASTLNVFYKEAQVASLSASTLGIPVEELGMVERYLPAKLASNKQLVASLLDELSPQAKKVVFERYPELSETK